VYFFITVRYQALNYYKYPDLHRSLYITQVLEFENFDSRPGIFVEILASPGILDI